MTFIPSFTYMPKTGVVFYCGMFIVRGYIVWYEGKVRISRISKKIVHGLGR